MIINATTAHAEELAPRLGPLDLVEIRCTTSRAPGAALAMSVSGSAVAWSVVMDGQVEAIYGVTPVSELTGHGAPWLLASARLYEELPLTFLRNSRAVLHELLSIYPALENYVHADHAPAIRWLRWLGFDLEPATPCGRGGALFHRFTMEA